MLTLGAQTIDRDPGTVIEGFAMVFRRRIVALVSAVVLAGGLAGMPAVAAETPVVAAEGGDEFKRPTSEANKNFSRGGVSAAGAALSRAKSTKKRVEVTSDRTATTTVWANPNGTFTRETAQAPIRAKNGRGELAPVDTALVVADERLRPKNTTRDTTFSPDGAGRLATFSLTKQTAVSMSVGQELETPDVDGAVATYPVTGQPDESVTVGALDNGFEARIVLKKAPKLTSAGRPTSTAGAGATGDDTAGTSDPVTPPTYTFDLKLDGLTAELVGDRVELRDSGGKVAATSRPLRMWDSAVDAAGDPSNVVPVDAELSTTAEGARLELTPSMRFLTDPATKYPVTIDPDIVAPVKGDTWYYTGQPASENRDTEFRVAIGSPDGSTIYRGFMSFAYKSYLGQTVTDASLKVYQYFAGSCTATPMNLYPSSNDVVAPIWDNQPIADGNSLWRSSKTFSHGGAGCSDADGFESIDVTPMVNAWAGRHKNGDTAGRERQGIHLRAVNETDSTQQKRFCSSQPSTASSVCRLTTLVPVLSVTYQPELGTQSWYSMTDHKLNDRSSMSVNNKTGNLVVGASDVNVKGIGLNLGVNRTYNSQATDSTSLGNGWNLSVGPDVWLEKRSSYRYDYHGPTGAVLGSFTRKSPVTTDPNYHKFSTPTGGAGADLEQSGSTFTLKFRGSQTKYVFTDNSPDDHAYLTKMQDRSDNDITFAYSGITSTGTPKLTSITDSSGRVYAITYGSGVDADHITKISNTAAGPGLREWRYQYTSGYLTTYTNPEGASTAYAYEDMASGVDLLDTITNPVNDSGKAPTTYITYGYDGNLDVNQVTKASYRHGDGEADLYNYTWDYSTTIPSACEGNGSFSTVVTDPNNHPTTYCFKKRTDTGSEDTVAMKTWVYDALSHARSVQYSADNGPVNVTNPSGQGITGGSTVATYSTQLPDQLQKVTAPKSDAANNATTGFEYNATGVAGGAYLPTAVKGDNGNCNRFGYDSKGRTTAAYTGIAATSDSASSCGSEGDADVKGFHRQYDDATGNVTESWDANSGSSPTSADKTVYTYWASGDVGYVADTAHQLKSVRKPGGDCAATVAAGRKLCTTYTYDGAGRVTSVTNGNAQKTTYAHDKMDRTTAAYFGGATGCALDFRNCRTYVYDAEGNLVSRTEDDLLSSTFDYDRLNRQIAQYNPITLLQPTDNIGMSYDGTGNLTAYAQLVNGIYDVAYYGYDDANRLSLVVDLTGHTYFAADSDGRTQSIGFPKPSGTNGVKVDYDYTKTGKPKALDIETHAGVNLAGFDYSYVVSLYGGAFQVETSQMRNRTVTGSLANLNSNVDYGYNKGSQLTSAMAASGTDYTYEYDNIGNITKEQGAATTYFGYDRAGQLCWKGSYTGAKLGQTCPATPTGNTTVGHDRAGNITNTTSDPIAYNDHDQVTDIGGVAMAYRDLGNDLRSTAGTTRMVSGPMGVTATATGSAVTFYTRDPQGAILNAHNATSTTNYVTEYNGSVVALYNPSGSAVGSYKYTPYGATGVNNESGGATAASNPFRYISGYQDKTSGGTDGYYKLGARYYDTHGHFTQADPIVRGGGSYAYTAGDPINSSDPSGMAASDTGSAVAEFGESMVGCLSVGSLTAGAYSAVATGIGYYGAAAAGVGAAMGTFGGGALLAATAGCAGFVIANGISPEVGEFMGDVADSFGKAIDGF